MKHSLKLDLSGPIPGPNKARPRNKNLKIHTLMFLLLTSKKHKEQKSCNQYRIIWSQNQYQLKNWSRQILCRIGSFQLISHPHLALYDIDFAVQYGDLIRARTHTSKVDNNLVVVVPMALSRILLMLLLYWTANLTKGEIGN